MFCPVRQCVLVASHFFQLIFFLLVIQDSYLAYVIVLFNPFGLGFTHFIHLSFICHSISFQIKMVHGHSKAEQGHILIVFKRESGIKQDPVSIP